MKLERASRVIPLVFGLPAVGLLAWGFVLNLSGHESTASWSLITGGGATIGGACVGTRRRR